MNDADMIVWIAEHLVSFRPAFNFATIEYIDNKGYNHEISVECDQPEASNTELLRLCVNKANESM